MLNTVDLLAALAARGIKNADIARTLNVAPSRVTEIKKGERSIKLDEAAKLASEYDLESPPGYQPVIPLPAPIARLVVRYVAAELGAPELDPVRVEDIAEDIRAFAEFVADPNVRESLVAAEAFFQAMRLRRSVPEPANQ